ncbi:MAG: amidohydrolase family protein [Proteobacteria bacterium]|nr:amidohydrolase family protein [Pseudomonadota bacterium]
MNFVRSDRVAAIRSRIDHPVIDGDGHLLEYTPLIRDIIAEDAGSDVAQAFDRIVHASEHFREVPFEQKRGLGLTRTAWWGLPAQNTLDRASAMLPQLMYRRLDEIGIDFALLYPTYGLFATGMPGDELRRAMARAYNRYYAEMYADYRDRLEPVAVIPTVTPEEAVAELEHAVVELGLKAVTLSGVVSRPVPGAEGVRGAYWQDTLAHDSDYDYDPLWKRCVELGVSPTFHGSTQGSGLRASRQSYVYNHIGSFAAAGEAACRSLFFHGVPMRFPRLHFAFLEGGVAWGANLYSDILAHLEKRHAGAIEQYDPARIDRDGLEGLMREYAPESLVERMDRLDEALLLLSDPNEGSFASDEFADSGVSGADDVREIFAGRFYFGCEADDPLTCVGLNDSILPGGARLRPVFASDVGHWDVPDFRDVLPEAYEGVEDGKLTPEDFRAFVFGNAVSLWGRTNPKFFDGTAVEAEARAALRSD